MYSKRRPDDGFTLVEILIVVAITGLILAVAVPHYMRVRTDAQKKACIATLGQIEAAKQIWGVENEKTTGDIPTEEDLVPRYLKTTPICPSLGVYDYKPVGENPTCTIPGHTL